VFCFFNIFVILFLFAFFPFFFLFFFLAAQYFLQEACEQIIQLGFDEEPVVPPLPSNNNSVTGNNRATSPMGFSPPRSPSPQGRSVNIPSAMSLDSHPSYNTSIPSTLVNEPSPYHPRKSSLSRIPDDASTIMTIDGDLQSKQGSHVEANNSSSSSASLPPPVLPTKIAYPLNKAIIIINYLHVLQKTESFTALKQAIFIKQFLIKCFIQLSNPEKYKIKNAIINEVEGISVFHIYDLIIPRKQINHISSIIDLCQKEYNYQEKQKLLLSSSSSAQSTHSIASSITGGGGGTGVGGEGKKEEEGDYDDRSIVSDLHSVNSRQSKHKKQRSKGKSATNSIASLSLQKDGETGSLGFGGDDNVEDGTVQSESKKRMVERENKQQKFQEQKRKDQLLRQEISKQRNKLYQLIQTNQISEIFARKANKMNIAEAPKWGSTSQSVKSVMEEYGLSLTTTADDQAEKDDNTEMNLII
jgi:hypothetical protein